MSELPSPADILTFWREAGPTKWFEKDDAFDAAIHARFLAAYEAAAAGQLDGWQETAEGSYALILLLDQFPRNLFRGSPRAFATDEAARAIADRAVERGFDRTFELPERRFIYMPFMHSEELADQERCVALCEASDDDEGVHHAVVHRDIIRDFGRFPHRNPVLGRASSDEEHAFLEAGGFAG
ncbi:DUF924 domain-containing protein [Starkeya koreensis]|uniref:DUF924 domain-containing protein n=1 Tax=Ancylobacter koreensis TaxID=266121 RepID=A0ABT0DJT9_9HYPH|nr:DUF924 family protein [Ancylobacter koreensis]MCK0207554.1 DUF924 domain-containing protein [Ancylobacter koreensis]